MTIVNINITTPNSTNTYAVKASVVSEYNYEQCSPSQATGIAVLRYSPSVAEVVAGEYYVDGSELIKYLQFTIEYDYVSVDYINIYIKKHSDVTWLLYGKELPASGQSTFALLPSDFIAGDDIDVKIEDSANATVIDIIENQHVYITLTIDSYPASTRLATNFTVSGKANLPDGSEITVRLTSVEGGLKERTAIVSSGAWSITDYQLLVADGFLPNQNISILAYYIDEVIDFKSETDAFGTIATFNLNAIGNQTAGVAFDVAGTTDLPDGAEVEVFAGATSKGTATVASGAFTKSVTIADPVNDVVIKVQDKLNANANDTETINVLVSQNDGQYMFAGYVYGGNAPRYSSNYGTSFTAVGSSKTINAIAVVDNGDFAIFAAYQSIFKIDKNGTLTTLKSITNNRTCYAIACSSNGQYILAFVLQEGLYKSSDYGANWTLVSNNTAITEKIFVSSDGSKQCYFTNLRPFFSSDYGANWTQRDTSDRNWNNICGSDDGSIIYGYLNGESKIFKFTSNGATIAQIGTSRQWNDISCSKDGSVVAGAIYQSTYVDYSTDSGASWGLKNTNASGYYGYRLVVVPDGSKIIVVTNSWSQGFPYMITTPFSSNSFAKLIDSNQEWSTRPASSNDGKYILIGPMSDNKTYYSQDFGANFSSHAVRMNIVAMNRKRT